MWIILEAQFGMFQPKLFIRRGNGKPSRSPPRWLTTLEPDRVRPSRLELMMIGFGPDPLAWLVKDQRS